jgi:hypothetical protein
VPGVQGTRTRRPLGHTLMPVMLALKDWAEAHMDEVLDARAGYVRLTAPHDRS